MAEKKIPDGLVADLIEEGLTNQEIVDELWRRRQTRVTRQAISAWRKRNGYEMQAKLDPNWCPWIVESEHKQLEPYRMLRMWARREQGLPMDEPSMARVRALENFLKKVGFDAVFQYRRDQEPYWFVVPRVDGDRGVMATAKRR